MFEEVWSLVGVGIFVNVRLELLQVPEWRNRLTWLESASGGLVLEFKFRHQHDATSMHY